MSKRKKRILGFLISTVLVLLAFAFIDTAHFRTFGGSPQGVRLERLKTVPMFQNGVFENIPPVPMIEPGTYTQVMRRQLFGREQRVPPFPVPVLRPAITPSPEPGLRVTWFGHASVLVEIDGFRMFTDPVFAKRVSPFATFGPERSFAPPLRLEELPQINAVVISHDHYDHLDMKAIQFLADKGTIFFVPLGIGAHLEAWGIKESQIVEMNWWDSYTLGGIKIVCTPAVHYSGRGLFSRNSTLWSSWSLIGPLHRFYFSGDTGYSPHFKEIGARLGPFDVAALKIGAYDYTWEGIHMNPEDAVRANQDLRGRRMLPVHWGTFNLAIHEWDEPIRRAKAAARTAGVTLLTPRPGETVEADKTFVSMDWWIPTSGQQATESIKP
ncbi:MAG: MBL fold metallo-hydrolase [Spirochaetia bacterium]|nr:MBL fold metallo-hydrolase [Spirochaetia bacterium]